VGRSRGEEISVPVPYRADRARAERILLDAAAHATADYAPDAASQREQLQRKFNIELDAYDPRVYWRLTDNWVQLSLRFIVPAHGIREIKDRLSREILAGLEQPASKWPARRSRSAGSRRCRCGSCRRSVAPTPDAPAILTTPILGYRVSGADPCLVHSPTS
jgi:hypothetical protein